ncbi:MAG TPA: hypothetical protein VGG39_13135 [Polyangiaceae bacterium]|jgi:hypothetical protein
MNLQARRTTRTTRTVRSLLSAAVLALLAGCASQSPDAAPSPVGVASDPLVAAPGATSAVALLERGGTFMFSLDESDPAAHFHAQCASESGGDKAKADACYAHVRDVGSQEGMRFALDGQSRVVWTSFGHEDGKEVVYIEAPLTVTADGEHAVLTSFAEAPRGPQLAGEKDWASKKVRIELPDASTMVMNDPRKGKLVFHRVDR